MILSSVVDLREKRGAHAVGRQAAGWGQQLGRGEQGQEQGGVWGVWDK